MIEFFILETVTLPLSFSNLLPCIFRVHDALYRHLYLKLFYDALSRHLVLIYLSTIIDIDYFD